MPRRAVIVDLDACSLLADATPGPRPPSSTLVPVKPERRNRGPAKLVLPKPQKRSRGGRDGRDEMLSEYLTSLGRIPLLTPEDEKSLAAQFRDAEVLCWRRLLAVDAIRERLGAHPIAHDIRAVLDAGNLDAIADALREVDDDRVVVDEMIASLVDDAALAETHALRRRSLAIRNKFVRANLRLVVSVARRFHHYRLPLIDLIQEGNLGLIKSVHRFDHRKGFRFSTYAHWWIRQAIERAIMNKGAQVRLPVHVFDARREVAKATRDLQAQLGRDPSVAELAKELETPVEKLEEILRAVPREPQSLDEPVSDDEERTLGEVISDVEAKTPDEHVIQVDEERWVRRVLTRLSPMEVDILTRRYGLDTDEDETLEEIGRTYNLSRERVRQIQVAGLKKIQRYVEVRLEVG
jgi:RNA polymerase sigma factor (sigma-70 family)